MTAQGCIQQLLEAENQAEQIIAKAKEERVNKMKQAKDAAAQEVALFKAELQADLDKRKASSTFAAELKKTEEASAVECRAVETEYQSNAAAAKNFILTQITTVTCQLNESQVIKLRAN